MGRTNGHCENGQIIHGKITRARPQLDTQNNQTTDINQLDVIASKINIEEIKSRDETIRDLLEGLNNIRTLINHSADVSTLTNTPTNYQEQLDIIKKEERELEEELKNLPIPELTRQNAYMREDNIEQYQSNTEPKEINTKKTLKKKIKKATDIISIVEKSTERRLKSISQKNKNEKKWKI